ncbi:MAG: aldo/keto reductase, partial [Parvularculaceae bacterium]
RARARGVGVVAIAPLAQGLYRRDFLRIAAAADAWRVARALIRNRRELSQARAARSVLEAAESLTPAQGALAFVRANPDIDVAVTTTTSLDRLAETLEGLARSASPKLLAALAGLSLDAQGSEP